MLEGFQYRSISGWSANAGLLAAVLTRGHSCLQECLQLFSGSLAQCWLADPPQMLLLQVAAQPGDRFFDPQHPALFRRRMHQDRRTPGSSLQCPPVAIPAVCRSACRSSRTTRHGAGSAIGSSRRLPDVDTANGHTSGYSLQRSPVAIPAVCRSACRYSLATPALAGSRIHRSCCCQYIPGEWQDEAQSNDRLIDRQP